MKQPALDTADSRWHLFEGAGSGGLSGRRSVAVSQVATGFALSCIWHGLAGELSKTRVTVITALTGTIGITDTIRTIVASEIGLFRAQLT